LQGSKLYAKQIPTHLLLKELKVGGKNLLTTGTTTNIKMTMKTTMATMKIMTTTTTTYLGDFCCTINATYIFYVISYYTFLHTMFRLLLSHLQVGL
jgi:hypothetical protein